MTGNVRIPLVRTIKEQCRMCYSCVRECPAKAIRISGGQAEVITERCIGCGNCVRVCSQNAKIVRNSTDNVNELLSGGNTAALLSSAFPAEFAGLSYGKVVSMMRGLGFTYVIDVAFGADLVSAGYSDLFYRYRDQSFISTTCPAIVFYIEKHHPSLVKNLAPIVSPMVASSRSARAVYGDNLKTVFIGPCIAGKDEAVRSEVAGEINEVLTFTELRVMLNKAGITPDNTGSSEFDPPHGCKGSILPIRGGILQASGLDEDLFSMSIVSAGHKDFIQAIKEFETVKHRTVLLELNCCDGCISGAGLSSDIPLFTKRGHVSAYARKHARDLDMQMYNEFMEKLSGIDISTSFHEDDRRLPSPDDAELKKILESIGRYKPSDELNCGACGYGTCVGHAVAIFKGLAEKEMCLPYTIAQLRKTAAELAGSYEQLVKARNAVIQSEKLASLGRMASGIAHEINNPLTGVLTYSSLMKEEMKGGLYEEDINVIINETMRCRKIVKGLLDFARNTAVEKIAANINDVITDTVSILRKQPAYQDVRMHLELAEDIPLTEIDVSLMRSVFNNLAENSAHAMPDGGDLIIKTEFRKDKHAVLITVSDTGRGISEENISKIFDPFFTTKKAGKGTGLGLAVIYGIIEQHNAAIDVVSKVGEGTTFTISIPSKGYIKI